MYTRFGYLFLLLGISLLFAGEFSAFAYPAFMLSFSCLVSSMFGVETFLVYRRAQKHIEEWGGVSEGFTKVVLTGFYCSRVGLQLAEKEFKQKKKEGMR
jgi:hypothetical protein